ncbi:flavodoxin [Suilimivivens sp.]|uniref:flavodoxin n=1 Tax=Suilimivivens sp. TaxID=2981669 RepID=UPI00307A358E
METVKIVFWSQGGNTAAMAAAVAEGVQEAGSKAEIINVSDASAADLQSMKGFALGCPAMGAEVLEEMEMEPFMCELEGSLAGKSVGLFGSYGWGDGQWMRDWEERCKAAGAAVVGGEGVICQETPDDDAIASCRTLGRALAAL